MSATRSAGRLDPDELALLEEERDHLLASLEDLEREFAAGDMDEVDYRELKDDYTVRTAEVLRAIEEQRVLHQRAEPARAGRGRALLVTAGVLLFAVVAGVLVAQGSGQRGSGPISGGISNLRAELARCQQASFQDPAGGVECYDELLEDAPENVEALTYHGWALIRDGRIPQGAEQLERAVRIDPDYPDVRVFRAIVAARAGDHPAAAEEIDRFYRSDPAPAAVQILQSQGLERELFINLLDDATRACWVAAAGEQGDAEQEAEQEAEQDATAFVGRLGSCLDDVIAADPAAVDALVSRAYAMVAVDTAALDTAAELVERAVAADPEDPNARLLQASLALGQGRRDVAQQALDALEDLPRPTMSFLIGGPEQQRRTMEAAAPADGASTTTTPDDRGASIPNRDGG
jgi:tetratricopeptide (TPR) repeat protein